MENKQALEKAEELLKPFVTDIKWISDLQVDFYLDKSKLLEAITELAKINWGYVSAISGVDMPGKAAVVDQASGDVTTPATPDRIEVIYTVCHSGAIANLRVYLPYDDLRVDSVCGVFPSATLFERELIEILGLTILETPNTDHLILPDSWPKGVYPLRKSFTGLQTPRDA